MEAIEHRFRLLGPKCPGVVLDADGQPLLVAGHAHDDAAALHLGELGSVRAG